MKLNQVVKKVNNLRPKFVEMNDESLLSYAKELRNRAQKETLNSLLPEAFALVREATRRALGKEHYDVQIMAGTVLHESKIAEAKTGEGKTITIYLAAFLNSLKNNVHVVTVNDYLANRDATDAKKVFEYLGVSVGCVLHESTVQERQKAYKCDITYVTNSELGFDYLKDHIAFDKDNLVLNGLNYAIIDEIDSILIDEAKTPLIISGEGSDSDNLLQRANNAVLKLTEGTLTETTQMEKLMGSEDVETGDFIKNEKENIVYLTENGIHKLEKLLNLDNYGSEENVLLQKAVNNALRANYMLKKDKDYIVRDDAVEIVDTFTGRVLQGRRFSDGLHQAIEVKENVPVQKENVTIASITFQSFFNKFKKKCGLTGTAKTSEKEFKNIYNLPVVEIPTNRPVIRKDLTDLVFMTKDEKWNAVVEEIKKTYETGQPILIGTTSIEDSVLLSDMLDEVNIPHSTLNAKNERLEAEIVSHAGEFKAVTVATNMAGRGTDIVLDEKAKEVGGLKVIGTERHDSKRIDNQLIGRSGRQGDPGTSQFFISLEDRIMRVFGEESQLGILGLIAQPGQPLEYKTLERIIQKAQDAVESNNRLIREELLKYDEANNEYREELYRQREEIIFADNIKDILHDFCYDVSDALIDKCVPDDDTSKWNLDLFFETYFKLFSYVNVQIDIDGMTKADFIDAIYQMDDMLIEHKEKEIGNQEYMDSIMRTVILRIIDRNWATFLTTMSYIRGHIGSESYAQRDPAVEYKKRGLRLFNQMVDRTKTEIVYQFLRVKVQFDDQQRGEQ